MHVSFDAGRYQAHQVMCHCYVMTKICQLKKKYGEAVGSLELPILSAAAADRCPG